MDMQPVGTAQPRPGPGGPAEYPEGGDWSVDARRIAWRWPWPGPQEYPIAIRTNALLSEVLRLRQRMYLIEIETRLQLGVRKEG